MTQLMITPTTSGSPFISPDLGAAASVQKSGYEVSMEPGTDGEVNTAPSCSVANMGPDVGDLISSYYAFADPVTPGSSGSRFFWTNTLGTIYVHQQGDGTLSGELEGSQAPAAMTAAVLQ